MAHEPPNFIGTDAAGTYVDPMHEALVLQQVACAALGSDIYDRLLAGIAADYADGGVSHTALAGRFDRPVHDAAPLRLMGAVHALALAGRAPAIAAHYPSCGGTPHGGMVHDFLSVVAAHPGEIEVALSRQVQTNEVGRSVVHLSIAHWLGARGLAHFDHLEVGASAGLNMNFDSFLADTGTGTMGDPASTVRFGPEWFDVPPPVTAHPAVVRARRGCDPFPIDVVTDPAQAARLLSFVWPDQAERFARTRAAIDIAHTNPPVIDTDSADAWVARMLASPLTAPTVVFHSIVWQYLGTQVQDGLRTTLERAGADATKENPLFWIRMEPAGAVAHVTATEWSGGNRVETILCEVGYHGRDMRWLA